MLVVKDTVFIKGELAQVFDCFWHPELWPQITSHVKAIEMLEQDDTHQCFRMQVESSGKLYSMETMREALVNQSITYRQSQPPPFFLEHTGEWSFAEADGCVQVALTHRVILNVTKAKELLGLNSTAEVAKRVSETLRSNGALTMKAVKAFVEQNVTTASQGVAAK